jgi:hypothetical protein
MSEFNTSAGIVYVLSELSPANCCILTLTADVVKTVLPIAEETRVTAARAAEQPFLKKLFMLKTSFPELCFK